MADQRHYYLRNFPKSFYPQGVCLIENFFYLCRCLDSFSLLLFLSFFVVVVVIVVVVGNGNNFSCGVHLFQMLFLLSQLT